MTSADLLDIVIKRDASDLHLIVGVPPIIRVDGSLLPIEGMKPLAAEEVKTLVESLVSAEQKDLLYVNKEVDLSFQLSDRGRFRINAYFAKGYVAAALRLIPNKIRTINELKLPSVYHQFTPLRQGFILVTGPTGHGKSTTLAAIIDSINHTRATHIVTIEDPIEYVYTPDQSIISQREMHGDTHSWDIALRSVLREDPDVVLIGEMRDYETIAAALTIAETGHLVLATLHTNSAAQTVDRVIDVFPEHQQAQVRMQFANTIEAILSQRLIPAKNGGRIPAVEVLLATPAVRNTIREGKSHQIDNIIQTSAELGMMTLETNLASWVQQDVITLDKAQEYSLRPAELLRLIKGS
ncbi:type IV pili twitching motility protein PilT [Microgenomates group bacterium RIFCSPHIGHO2_01_FULL_45_11]|nr:MAG: type IV pili twitching motility protein PilT [Microgenomates group bacterium RIFCSPHIGHO2_01_FULL_45_11]